MSLFSRSVASITASLQTMITKLDAHVTEMNASYAKHTAIANAANEEALQAKRVHDKLVGILD